MKEGIEKKAAEIARKLKAMGIPVKKIAAASGLSPEEIKDL
jgi:predicted transposase YdaD